MLTTLNSQQTFLLEKLNDATAILEQEDNITNRTNLMDKNLEGQGKLACVFGKIKGDLADLIGAAMRKNLNRKNSAPPAGSYNPSNPCETEEIVADVLANTQQQVRGGFMDALKSLAGGGGIPSLGRLGTAFNKLENLNIPSELDVASLLPSFDQSLDVGGLLGKLPPIGGFDVGQELSFDMALANTFISSVAAFTECDPPEECPETDTLTLGGDQDKKSETNPVNTDNIANLNSQKLIEKAKGNIPPEIGDVVQLNDGTKQYYKGVEVKSVFEGTFEEREQLSLNSEDEEIKYVEKPPITFEKPTYEKEVISSGSLDIVSNEDETVIISSIRRNETENLSGTIQGGQVVGADQNSLQARKLLIRQKIFDLKSKIRMYENQKVSNPEAFKKYNNDEKIKDLNAQIAVLREESRNLR